MALRYFVGERPLHADMICLMLSLSARQILHVPSSLTLKTCFLIYLVEIVYSWMETTVNFVAFFRIEDFSHWLDCSFST